MSESKTRLDQRLVTLGLAPSRSQAENFIKLGFIKLNGKIINKSGYLVSASDKIELTTSDKYVSRAALKLKSVAEKLKINFKNMIVLDVGSSTGGFTDFALQHGARKVIAVDVGTNQLHPSLLTDSRIELHEKTDIRDINKLSTFPDIVLIDVSFISINEILPHIAKLINKNSIIVAMVKPQFEAGTSLKHKGVIKNDNIRRQILRDFELSSKKLFKIIDKADSEISGSKGNRERFYLLKRSDIK